MLLALPAGAWLAACDTAADAPAQASGDRTVNLITGDRVTLGPGDRVARFEPGPGREQVGYVVERGGGRVVVIPLDAAPRIASGELDAALFEVAAPGAALPAAAADAPTVKLHVDAVDSLGNPTGGLGSLFGGPGTFRFIHPPQTLDVTPGVYAVTMLGSTEPSLVVNSRVEVTSETSVLLDGRLSKFPEVSVPGQPLDIKGEQLIYRDTVLLGIGVTSPNLLRTAYVGPELPGELSSIAVIDAVPAGQTDGRSTFAIAHREDGHLFTGFTEVATRDRLTTVQASHRARPDQRHRKLATAIVPDLDDARLDAVGAAIFDGAFERTEHYLGDGILWVPTLEQLGPEIDGELEVTSFQGAVGVTYPPGRRIAETWNRAPFGPAFATIGGDVAPRRDGDFLLLAPSLFSEVSSPSRAGISDGSQRLAVSCDGVLIGEQLDDPFEPFGVDLPAAPATCRFEAQQTRDASVSELSSEVRATWSFRTARASSAQILALPVVRFTPALDRNNASRAGVPLILPAHVERPAGAATPAITALTIEASFDDGATWRPVHGARIGGDFVGVVLPPAKAAFVSLRATASDVAGNRVEQTIVRASKLR